MELPQIVHEDGLLLAINQPAKAVSPRNARSFSGAGLLQLLRARFGEEMFPVHRLDPEASGCALFARTKAALDFFSGQFQAKTAQSIFFALVQAVDSMPTKIGAATRSQNGEVASDFSIDAPLLPDPTVPGKFRVAGRGRGKDALSRFSVAERFGNVLWVSCRPETSRPHQLRVHLAAAGLPIVGDTLYGADTPLLRLADLKRDFKGAGGEKPMLSRLALHAAEVILRHPEKNEPLRVAAPLPKDFEVALRNLRKFTRGRKFSGRRFAP